MISVSRFSFVSTLPIRMDEELSALLDTVTEMNWRVSIFFESG